MADENKKINESLSPGQATEEAKFKGEAQVLSEKQTKAMAFYTKRFNKARDDRNKARPEFDGLSYEYDYELNKRAAYSYLPPKKNDDEVRVVTGVTEKKVEVVWNELIATNFQPEILAYDKDDNEMVNLGVDVADIISRTNKIEKDDDFWEEWIRELLTQRAVFTEEIDVYDSILNRGTLKMDEKGGKISSKIKTQTFHYTKKRIISGLQVYLGDITLPFYRFQEQPYIIKYYRKSYAEAKKKYGLWNNWNFVKAGNPKKNQPFGYRMNDLDDDDVEEIHYIDPTNDEFMIEINGVLMFDEPAPLPYTVTPDRRYNMDMQAVKGIALDFAYGKSLVSSAKTLQGLNSEMIRLMIRKFRQVIEPPMVTKSKKIFSKDIWGAGAITQGVDAKEIELLNTGNQGLTSGEFNMYQLIENEAERFITGGVKPGAEKEGGTPTATEVLNDQKQFIKNLGLSLLALMRGKRNATYLRLYNVMDNFTKPKKNLFDELTNKFIPVFEKFTNLEGTFENGKKGKKIIQLMDRDITPEEKEGMFDFEQKEERVGRPTRIVVINVKRLIGVAMNWYVAVVQKERDGSPLNKVMFTDKIKQAAGISELTGRQLNADTLIEEYESTWQTKDMFKDEQRQGAETEEQGLAKEVEQGLAGLEGGGQTQMGDQLKEGGVSGEQNRPSLNTVTDQV